MTIQDSVMHNNRLNIATFNLFNYAEPPYAFYEFERIYSLQQWQKKQRWISHYINTNQPDIIGFQEVFSIDSLQSLLQMLGYDYFSVVDSPEVIDDFIYKRPVVALASKYPIISSSTIEANAEHIAALGLANHFKFSRKILHATINIPQLGLTDCYVVHFKSKRSMIEYNGDLHDNCIEKAIKEQLKAKVAGGWASSIQRGSEAALLLLAMLNHREKTGQPMILMGDFNNTLNDGVLTHLLSHSLRYVSQQNHEQYLAKYSLYDAWDLYIKATDNDIKNPNCLADSNKQLIKKKRKPTHYFASTSSVLDYVLLSCEFDASHHASFFQVTNYSTFDEHLINPIFDRDGESTDHAIVQITLTTRS